MKYVVLIHCNGAAFGDDPGAEVARILRKLADMEDGHPHFAPGHEQGLRDLNGNEVGFADVIADDQIRTI